MRTFHCTVALLLMAGLAAAQTPATPPNPAHFTVFLKGMPVGTEEVTVIRTPDGVTISGTARLGPPLNLTVRRAELRYAPDGTALECTVEGSIQDQLLGIHTVINGSTATTDATQGTQTGHKVDQVSPGTVLLPNAFFGGYEALAARLLGAKPGDELKMYIPPQAEIGIKVNGVSEETIRTPAGIVRTKRVGVQLQNPGRPLDAEIWVEPSGRLLRLIVPAQSLDYARNDIVSVASRRESVSHAGDEQVSIPANGFNLAATVSKPSASLPKGVRLPAVVLVAGSGDMDRDEAVAAVPIFGQLASALADAGFIVVRYDKRGVGQSGGRMENASLTDYAEDVRAVVKALGKRKDVDPKQVAVAGYGDGGAVAMTAAAQDGDIRALALLAAPGTTGADLILEQQARALGKMNLSDADRQAKVELQKKINQAALTGRGWSELPPGVRKQADTPWFQSFLAFDPSKTMRKVRQPVLILTGALDREIPPANAEKLEALARARKGQPGQAVKRVDLPGLNHLLVQATTGEVDEYGRVPDKTISAQVPAAIAGWLKDVWARK